MRVFVKLFGQASSPLYCHEAFYPRPIIAWSHSHIVVARCSASITFLCHLFFSLSRLCSCVGSCAPSSVRVIPLHSLVRAAVVRVAVASILHRRRRSMHHHHERPHAKHSVVDPPIAKSCEQHQHWRRQSNNKMQQSKQATNNQAVAKKKSFTHRMN